MYMTTNEIRATFLDYFKGKGHQVVASSPLVPHNDPSLLFTNAGMNQFKDIYLGKEKRSYNKATTAQKCVRAGGKHNDLDNVGYTARHHTFFEMLGNFSFGDYFKKEAINYAWELLTEGFKLPKESLMVTVYANDQEAFDIWHKDIGLPPEKIVAIGDNKGGAFNSDNFWQMGDTGPCGPCSEIFYDHGPEIWGGPPGSADEDGDRFIEIWNLVFTQYNRQADGTFEHLARPMIDTGMGLERIAAVLQGVHSNYDIDLFRDLIAHAGKVLNVSDLSSKSLRVISDHIRSCAFLIADGVLPSNEGRGYVLRRIIRRAVRHGRLLGASEVFFYKMAGELAKLMGDHYPELTQHQTQIEQTLQKEEEQFLNTLDRGLSILEDALEKIGAERTIPGDVIFKLYDTYGFPADLTQDIVRDRGYIVDMQGFEKQMQKQREQAKSASKFGVDYNKDLKLDVNTEFDGYETLDEESSILKIIRDGDEVEGISTDEHAVIVLDKTPFYAEMGGQIGDAGVLESEGNVFIVKDTRHTGGAVLHIGSVELGQFRVGQKLKAKVDAKRRANIAIHHSATHLLHSALRQVLGDHVYQKGSSVGPDRLRFDFSHGKPLSIEERQEIVALVNEKIRANYEIGTEVMGLEQAKQQGAMALFGEKYADDVRVVSMGDFSKELCGGTHARRTGDLGTFILVSDESIASGVRRVEALVGESAINYEQALARHFARASNLLKTDSFSMVDKMKTIIDHQSALEHENMLLKEKLVAIEAKALADKATDLGGVSLVVADFGNYSMRELRFGIDAIKNQLPNCVIVLGTVENEKVNLIAGVSKGLTDKIKASELVSMVAGYVGGKGGGRPDMAQAGGTKPEGLPDGLKAVPKWVKEHL